MQIPTLNFQLPELGPEVQQYLQATAITATTSYVVTKSAKTTAWRNGGVGLLVALSPYIFNEAKSTSELVTLMLIYSGIFSSSQHLSYLGYNSLESVVKFLSTLFSKQLKPGSSSTKPGNEFSSTAPVTETVESDTSFSAKGTEDEDLSDALSYIFLNNPTKDDFVHQYGFQKLYEVLNHEKVIIQTDNQALRLSLK